MVVPKFFFRTCQLGGPTLSRALCLMSCHYTPPPIGVFWWYKWWCPGTISPPCLSIYTSYGISGKISHFVPFPAVNPPVGVIGGNGTGMGQLVHMPTNVYKYMTPQARCPTLSHVFLSVITSQKYAACCHRQKYWQVPTVIAGCSLTANI